jgi:hypothetical protein
MCRSALLVEETGVLGENHQPNLSQVMENFITNSQIGVLPTLMLSHIYLRMRGRRVRIVVGFTTTFAISVYHLLSCEFESRLWPPTYRKSWKTLSQTVVSNTLRHKRDSNSQLKR